MIGRLATWWTPPRQDTMRRDRAREWRDVRVRTRCDGVDVRLALSNPESRVLGQRARDPMPERTDRSRARGNGAFGVQAGEHVRTSRLTSIRR